MLRLLCTAEFDDGWTERFGKLVEIDRVGFSLDKDPDKRMGKEQIIKACRDMISIYLVTKNCRRKYCINVLI